MCCWDAEFWIWGEQEAIMELKEILIKIICVKYQRQRKKEKRISHMTTTF
jgi:hypothetical protein